MNLLKNLKIINDLDGLIVIDKPKGYTSNDTLSIIKKILHPKKIGHTGTLDENATGVLVCLLGNATKSQEYLMKKGQKVYEAELIVGFSTDTFDITGNIIEVYSGAYNQIKDTDEKLMEIKNKIISAIKTFDGEYNQIPPMYSAKKVNGVRLASIARKGKTIDRKPSKVIVYDIEILKSLTEETCVCDKKIDICKYILKVVCSKGTYIRTLCKDIGDAIGIPCCMGNLRRITNGYFDIKESITIDALRKKVEMNDYSFIKPCYYTEGSTVVTFGKFETLHLGHEEIIKKVVNIAKNNNWKSVVMIVGDNDNNEVMSHDQRISKLKYLGVDKIVNYKLTEANRTLSPIDFIHEILHKELNAKAVVVGTDSRFGYKGQGDSELLKKECEKLSISVEVVEKIKIPETDIIISSTYIKEEYKKGNIDLVNIMLGR